MENSEILNLLSWYLPKKSKNILRLVSKTTRKYVLTDCLCNYECKLNCKCKCEICNSKEWSKVIYSGQIRAGAHDSYIPDGMIKKCNVSTNILII
jgi:hypothetical protein